MKKALFYALLSVVFAVVILAGRVAWHYDADVFVDNRYHLIGLLIFADLGEPYSQRDFGILHLVAASKTDNLKEEEKQRRKSEYWFNRAGLDKNGHNIK